MRRCRCKTRLHRRKTTVKIRIWTRKKESSKKAKLLKCNKSEVFFVRLQLAHVTVFLVHEVPS